MTQFKSPLIWRLILWFLLLSLIPIGIVLVFVQSQVRNIFVDEQIQGLSDQARLLSQQIASQPERTQKIIEGFGFEDQLAFLLDENGIYIAHSDPNKVGTSAGSDISADALHQLLTGQITKINDTTNLKYIGSDKIEKNNYIAVIMENSATRTIKIDELSRRIILQLAVSLLITSLAGGAAVLVVLGPIIQLSNFADRLGSGDLGAEFDVTDLEGELATLAKSLNNLATRVRSSISTLEQRVADRTKALTTSTEVSRRLSTILDQKQLVSEVVNQVKNAFGYYHTQIYFYNEARDNLVMAGGTGEAGEKMLAQFHKIAKGRGLVGRAAESNEPVLVADTTQDLNWLPNPLLPETKSEITMPIAIGDKVLGVLDVQHNVVDGLKREDVDALQSIANQVAVALQNIGSVETTAKRAKELASVAEISTASSRELDINKMLENVVHLTQRRFGLYHAHVFLYDDVTDDLSIIACGWKQGDEHEGTHGTAVIPVAQEQSLVARAARTRHAVIVNDVHNEPGWLPNPLLPDTASELAVPLLAGDKLIGVFDVQSDRLNAFSEEDANIQATLASQIAVTVQNARSFLQSQRQAERETSLNLITQKIQSTTSIEAALQITARELGHALGMKSTMVSLDLDTITSNQDNRKS